MLEPSKRASERSWSHFLCFRFGVEHRSCAETLVISYWEYIASIYVSKIGWFAQKDINPLLSDGFRIRASIEGGGCLHVPVHEWTCRPSPGRLCAGSRLRADAQRTKLKSPLYAEEYHEANNSGVSQISSITFLNRNFLWRSNDVGHRWIEACLPRASIWKWFILVC